MNKRTPTREESTNAACNYPLAPVRHMQIMAKLARCKFCNRLCCCVEHRIEHENSHKLKDTASLLPRSGKKSIKAYKCEAREFIYLNDLTTSLHVKESNFPLCCIYCKIKIANEHNLIRILKYGPQCPYEDSHLIVPVKQSTENKRKHNLKYAMERKIKSVSTIMNQENDKITSLSSFKASPILSHDENKLSKENNQLFSSTPQENFLSNQCTLSESSQKSAFITKGIFCTSTPQDSYILSSDMAISNAASSPLLGEGVQNIQKLKGSSSRRVTFSHDLEMTKYISDDGLVKSECVSGSDMQGSKLDEKDNKNLHQGRETDNDKSNSQPAQIKPDTYCNRFTDNTRSNTEMKQTAHESDSIIVKENSFKTTEDCVSLKHNEYSKENDMSIQKSKIVEENALAQIDNCTPITVTEKVMPLTISKEETFMKNESNEYTSSNSFATMQVEEKNEISVKGDMLYEGSFNNEEKEVSKEHVDKTAELYFSGIESLTENSCRMSILLDNLESVEDLIDDSVKSRNQIAHSEVKENIEDGSETDSVDSEHLFCKRDGNDHEEFLIVGSSDESNKFNFNSDFSGTVEESELLWSKSYNSSLNDPLSSELNISQCTDTSEGQCSTSSHNTKDNSEKNENTSLRKITTAFSSSWCLAKSFISQSLGRKRDTMDWSEDDSENKMPEKRMKLSQHDCTCSYSSYFPVQWKCHQKPTPVYNYKIKGRRPLSRMIKCKCHDKN